jgi:FSR family fosmidomycin resistance protein-like MFS transporter
MNTANSAGIPPVHASPEQPGAAPGPAAGGEAVTGRSTLPALGTGAVAAVVFAHLACDLFPGYSAPLLRHLKENWELTRLQTALLTVPVSAVIMLQPLVGLVADRMRTRAFVVMGLAMSALGYGALLPMSSLQPQSFGYWMAMIGMWMGGAGVAAYHPQGAALTGRAKRSGSGRGGVALFVFAGTVGYGAGFFVPPLFIEPGYTKWIPCLTALAAAALACQVFVPRLRPAGEALSRPRIGEVFAELRSEIRPVFRPLLVFWLMVVLRAVTLISFNYFVSIYYRESLGLSSLGGAGLVAGFFMSQALVGPLAARAADRVGERLVLLVSFLGGGALLALSLVASLHGWAIASYAFLLTGGGVLGGTVPLNVAAGQRLLKRSAAMGSGIMIGFAWGTGGLIVPLLARLGDVFSSTAVMLGAALTLVVPSALLCLLVPRKDAEAPA